MLEIVIQNWDDLQRAVFDDVWDEKIMRYRANRIYRGAADKDWRLVPSLNRVCAHDLSLEQAVIRSFRKYGYTDLAQYTGFWQLLPVAQHYGLPTRLLDWSYSPLVAAHFATEDTDAYDRDGAIWCIDATEVKHRLPKRLRKRLEEANCNIFSLGLLEEEVRDFAEMQALSPEPYALFFEPASMLDRIANQYALFSVVSDPGVLLSDILEQQEIDYYKIIIPREVKLEIRDKLDYINISERMLYPGLDGICRWIARQYSALGPKYNRRRDGSRPNA